MEAESALLPRRFLRACFVATEHGEGDRNATKGTPLALADRRRAAASAAGFLAIDRPFTAAVTAATSAIDPGRYSRVAVFVGCSGRVQRIPVGGADLLLRVRCCESRSTLASLSLLRCVQLRNDLSFFACVTLVSFDFFLLACLHT
jgi:hypothetical protein